ncbi:hypothetical protein Tco_0481792 [Tanacetum coccineum]
MDVEDWGIELLRGFAWSTNFSYTVSSSVVTSQNSLRTVVYKWIAEKVMGRDLISNDSTGDDKDKVGATGYVKKKNRRSLQYSDEEVTLKSMKSRRNLDVEESRWNGISLLRKISISSGGTALTILFTNQSRVGREEGERKFQISGREDLSKVWLVLPPGKRLRDVEARTWISSFDVRRKYRSSIPLTSSDNNLSIFNAVDLSIGSFKEGYIATKEAHHNHCQGIPSGLTWGLGQGSQH